MRLTLIDIIITIKSEIINYFVTNYLIQRKSRQDIISIYRLEMIATII